MQISESDESETSIRETVIEKMIEGAERNRVALKAKQNAFRASGGA